MTTDLNRENEENDSAHYEPVIALTAAARAVVMDARAQEPDADSLAMWVEVAGVRNGAYDYDIYFQATSDARPDDVVQHDDELPIVVPAAGLERLRGSRLDVSDDGGGLVMVNPNTPPPGQRDSVPQGDLTTDLAKRVLAVLENEINPSIAAHGGRADLVAVGDGVGYLRLGGGGQGCGMAKVTLSQGIEVAITSSISEITSVVDVTDHATGSNPYYEPAKK
ncbi:MAG: NifU family protein [Actinobacteria bacterium]|nr:NifU family protein [Actinomycetota bacterium]